MTVQSGLKRVLDGTSRREGTGGGGVGDITGRRIREWFSARLSMCV